MIKVWVSACPRRLASFTTASSAQSGCLLEPTKLGKAAALNCLRFEHFGLLSGTLQLGNIMYPFSNSM